MADSPSESAANSPTTIHIDPHVGLTGPAPKIPIEIVSDEEMALIEAALAATRSLVSSSTRLSPASSSFQIRARSIQSITLLSKKRISGCQDLDIEDSGNLNLGRKQKKNRVSESYLQRFRRKRALGVTDFTATEWCEKQMEYVLVLGRRKVNRAMKAGQARHLELEEEVLKRVKVSIESDEDRWAVKLIGFITGVNQLLFEGLTRELPLIGFLEGAWVSGVIDEIRMPLEESSDKSPLLVDTKTRLRDTLPAEPQRRNGKLQLMLYKLLWDSLVANEFPSRQFFSHFCLNPNGILSRDIRDSIADAGFSAQTLDDILRYYINTCKMLPLTHNQLLLRYEFQKDHSLLAEVRFDHDPEWLTSQLQQSLEFWKGDREARFVPEDERWKCRHCQFSSVCDGNSNLDNGTQTATPSTSPGSSSSPPQADL